jgi:predicted extracellular nuclease
MSRCLFAAPLAQYTELNAPSVTGYAAYVQTLQRSQIILDDRSGAQNPASVPGRGGQSLSASNTLRAGDGVDRVIGVLDQFSDAAASEPYLTSYRVQPTQTPQFSGRRVPRLLSCSRLGAASLKIASANVLNFFNLTGATSGSSQVMFSTPRAISRAFVVPTALPSWTGSAPRSWPICWGWAPMCMA